MKQVLATGTVRSPHGVNGFVKVRAFSDDHRHFLSLKEATLSRMGKEKHVEIETVQLHGDDILMKFKGIDSPEEARFISGWDILVPRDRASRLGKGEVYTADLIGVKLIYGGEEAAEIVSTMEGAQALLLECRTPDGKLHLVPFLRGVYVDKVDVEAQTMELLLKGLLE